jgi:hypothetical protein
VPPGAGIVALRVIRHQVVLWPYRKECPRVERKVIADGEMGGAEGCAQLWSLGALASRKLRDGWADRVVESAVAGKSRGLSPQIFFFFFFFSLFISNRAVLDLARAVSSEPNRKLASCAPDVIFLESKPALILVVPTSLADTE